MDFCPSNLPVETIHTFPLVPKLLSSRCYLAKCMLIRGQWTLLNRLCDTNTTPEMFPSPTKSCQNYMIHVMFLAQTCLQWRAMPEKKRNPVAILVLKVKMATNCQFNPRNGFLTFELASCDYSHMSFNTTSNFWTTLFHRLISIIYAN